MQLWVINQSVVSTYKDIKGNMQVNLGMSSPKKDVQQKIGTYYFSAASTRATVNLAFNAPKEVPKLQ